MEQKILDILLDMQGDIKSIKKRMENMEARQDKMEQHMTNIGVRQDKSDKRQDSMENYLKSIKKTVDNIMNKELPNINVLLDNIINRDLPEIKYSIGNIENKELPAIRQQRLIDSNNIAKILNRQTKMNKILEMNFQGKEDFKMYR